MILLTIGKTFLPSDYTISYVAGAGQLNKAAPSRKPRTLRLRRRISDVQPVQQVLGRQISYL